MPVSPCMRWLRCLLLAGLCYALVLQVLLAQAAGIEATTADSQLVLCHGNGDQSPGDGDGSLVRCHFCWLPVSGAALLPDTAVGIAAPVATVRARYSFPLETIVVTRPPPRGASQAPPAFA